MLAPRTCCEPEAPPGGACPCPDPAADAGALPAERNRYFTGKYMTARDLQAEQAYLVGRHRLHQRVLHGWGIAAGLDVVPHPNRECALSGWVVVTPGVAVDCYGREVVVREPFPLRLPAVFLNDVDCGKEEANQKWDEAQQAHFPNTRPQANTKYLLVVKYAESCVEPVPVFADADGCAPRKTANRVSEGVCFRFMAYNADTPPACWRRPRPAPCPCPPETPAYPPKFPASLEDVLGETCDADCKGAVPLAVVEFFEGANEEPAIPPGYLTDPAKYIDVEGRRYLPGPLNPRQLTHVCDVSWEHDGDTPESTLWGAYHDAHGEWGVRLTVTFDRPLHAGTAAAVEKSGARFFTVRFENHDGYLQAVGEKARVSLSEDHTHLHYDIEKCDVRPGFHNDARVRVELDCDFLTDRWGRAVDGDHLHGSLAHTWDGATRTRHPKGPSGDGTEGGTFVSWFRLIDGAATSGEKK